MWLLFKQKTAYERRISDWSSDVCSSDLAIEQEARRQIQVLEEGVTIVQETRLFDGMKGTSRSMRSKEEAHDYRYFPDPDLLPLELDAAWVKEIEASLPELPDEKKARFVKDSGLPVYDAGVLVADRDTAAFFETVAEGRDPKRSEEHTSEL